MKLLTLSSVFVFQLYNEVQARRGANDITPDNQKDGGELECGRGHHGNGLFAPGHHGKNHSGAITVPHHYSNGCNYSANGYSYPVSHQNGYGYCHTSGVSEIGDLLQDYLVQGKQMSRKNNGARHVVSKGDSRHFPALCLILSASAHLRKPDRWTWYESKLGFSEEHIDYS